MKKKLISSLKFIFFLGLGLFLVWWALKDLTSEQIDGVKESLRNANYGWLLLTFVFAIISHVSRSIRWKMLLKPIGYQPKLSNTFYAVMVGYLANLAFPRLGEVSRCAILKRYDDVPIDKSMGTVVVDRVFDLISLGVVFVLAIILQLSKIDEFKQKLIELNAKREQIHEDVTGQPDFWSQYGNHLLIAVIVLIIMGLIVFRKTILSSGLFKKIKHFATGIFEGIKSVKDVENPLAFLLHTILIWVMYFLMVYVSLWCFDSTANLGVGAALSILGFGALAMIATQGGLGAYPIAVQSILTLYAVAEEPSIAVGWVIWVSQTALIIIIGLISLIMLPLSNKK